MNGKQKIYFLLDALEDARLITPSGQPLKIHASDDLKNNYKGRELDGLFTKLEKDLHIIKVLKVGNRVLQASYEYGLNDYDDGCWHIELRPEFDEYYLKIQYEEEYQDFTGKSPPEVDNHNTDEPVNIKNIYSLPSYSAKSKKIAESFSPENNEFVLNVLNGIKVQSDFILNNKLNYKLQSPSGQYLMMERALLKKLENFGLFRHLGEDGIFAIATLKDLDIKLLKEVIGVLESADSGVISSDEFEEIKIRHQIQENLSQPSIKRCLVPHDNKLNPSWSDDFRWSGKQFVFGKYGMTSKFSSKERISLFQELTNAKGSWVKISELRKATNKPDNYIRPINWTPCQGPRFGINMC